MLHLLYQFTQKQEITVTLYGTTVFETYFHRAVGPG